MNGSYTVLIVADYVQFCLQRRGLAWHGGNSCPQGGGSVADDRVLTTMRSIGTEFEERYTQVFNEMCRQLHVTPDNAQSTFNVVIAELFDGGGDNSGVGISWGRVVALIAFAGSLAVECIRKEMPSLVDQVITWTSQYIDRRLASWIQQNGSWEGFVAFYMDTHNCKTGDAPWSSLRSVCGYAIGAVGVLALGAVLARSS